MVERPTTNRWLLVTLIAGLLGVSYAGFTMAFSGPEGPAEDGAREPSADVPAPGPGEKKVVLEDLGMVCPLCAASVSAQLDNAPGVLAYDVDLSSDSVTVLYDSHETTVDDLKEAIAKSGFQVGDVREVQD